MLCVMMLPLVVVELHAKAVCQSVREATTPPAWIMQPPRLADTAERDYFTLRERLIAAKTTGRNSMLMSSADRVAHIGKRSLINGRQCASSGSINA